MQSLRLLIRHGVALPGGINALPGETHEVEARFGRGLLYDGRAIPARDVVDEPMSESVDTEGPQSEEPDLEELQRGLPSIQDRDPRPINRDPSRRRQGPRS